jgi:hypothetical protein
VPTTTDEKAPRKRHLIPPAQQELLDRFRAQLPEELQGRAYLDEQEVAAVLSHSVLTIRKWRERKVGPRWRRQGPRTVRYSILDLAVFANGGDAP